MALNMCMIIIIVIRLTTTTTMNTNDNDIAHNTHNTASVQTKNL